MLTSENDQYKKQLGLQRDQSPQSSAAAGAYNPNIHRGGQGRLGQVHVATIIIAPNFHEWFVLVHVYICVCVNVCGNVSTDFMNTHVSHFCVHVQVLVCTYM